MNFKLFLLPLLLLFSINSLFAVKTTTATTEKENSALVTVQPKKEKKKSGFFQKILEKKFVKKITKKLGISDHAPNKASGVLFGILATSLGVLGIILLFIPPLGLIGLLMGIAAFVLGLIGIRRDNKIALSLIGTILGGLMILLIILAVALFATLLNL